MSFGQRADRRLPPVGEAPLLRLRMDPVARDVYIATEGSVPCNPLWTVVYLVCVPKGEKTRFHNARKGSRSPMSTQPQTSKNVSSRAAAQFKEFAYLTLGGLLTAFGIYFFKFPNNFSTGGVSGISVILGHYISGFTPGDFVMVINMLLLLVGFLVFGRSFGLRTAYVSTLMSVAIWVLERALPMSAPMTTQPFMELIFAVSLPAVGSAILFNMDASTGGTDIVAMLLRKFTSLDIGKALMCSDLIITLLACVAFGMETGLYSILGLVIKSLLVDMVMENIHTHKCFHIITANPAPIEQYISHTLHRGATKVHGEGVYTHEGREVLLTVMNRREAVQLRRYIKQFDPEAFLLITNTSEIIGKGFRGVN